MSEYSMTPRSKNDKTGPLAVSMSPSETCPVACELYDACYAKGRMLLVWRKLDEGTLASGEPFSDFLRTVRNLPESCKLWRHNQCGDLPGNGAANRLRKGDCLRLARANAAGGRNRGGFTFTHYPVFADPDKGVSEATASHNRDTIREMNRAGFTVNLSADRPDQIDAMVALGIAPVVVLVAADTTEGFRTAAGNRVKICPAALTKHGVTCAECGLCQRAKRTAVVAFPAHGCHVKKADRVAKGDNDA